jgi:dienelactone hydrolase
VVEVGAPDHGLPRVSEEPAGGGPVGGVLAGAAALREAGCDRALALAALKAQPRVDAGKLAAVGYCYGGAAALELARGGADLKAVVGFHSTLTTARPRDAANIKGKVLVHIGADDPAVPAEQCAAFQQEMTAGGVDWRLMLYGRTGHSFTNPEADSWGLPGFSYAADADRRSWAATKDLFQEVGLI